MPVIHPLQLVPSHGSLSSPLHSLSNPSQLEPLGTLFLFRTTLHVFVSKYVRECQTPLLEPAWNDDQVVRPLVADKQCQLFHLVPQPVWGLVRPSSFPLGHPWSSNRFTLSCPNSVHRSKNPKFEQSLSMAFLHGATFCTWTSAST